MTKNRSLKHAARRQAAQSGRSYTAALRELTAKRAWLEPADDDQGHALRYVETHGGQRFEATLRDPYLIARAYGDLHLDGETLHQLNLFSPTASHCRIPLHIEKRRVLDRINHQLLGSVGTFSAQGVRLGVWARTPGGILVTDSPWSFDGVVDGCNEVMGRIEGHHIYAMSDSGLRIIYNNETVPFPAPTAPDKAFSDFWTKSWYSIQEALRKRRPDDFALIAGTTLALDQSVPHWFLKFFIHSGEPADSWRASLETGSSEGILAQAEDMMSYGRLPLEGSEAREGDIVRLIDDDFRQWVIKSRDSRYIVLCWQRTYRVVDLAWNEPYEGRPAGEAMITLDGSDAREPHSIITSLYDGSLKFSDYTISPVWGFIIQ